MQKKSLIAVAIAVVLWVTFMGYRHVRNKRDTQDHTAKKQEQLVKIAKNSPRGGLVLIARALNRFYQDNSAYPLRLMDLYPEYLPSKSLVEQLDCHYEPREGDFFLSTTFTSGKRRMVAYLNRDLRLETEKGVMVAAPSLAPKAEEITRPKEAGTQERKLSNEQRRTLARAEFLEAVRQSRMLVTSVSLAERKDERLIDTVQPEVISTVESGASSGVESALSQRYLVWKGKDGVLGFSNVQYPVADSLSIYAVGRWYNVKIPLPKGPEPLSPVTRTARRKESPEMIASGLSPSYLAWRDRRGTLGFGNVQYPEKHLASVFQTDSWVKMKKPPVPPQTSEVQAAGRSKAKSLETIASDFGTSFLVWKDKNGTLGFSNVQYPEKHLASVFQTDSWVKMKRPPVAPQTSQARATGRLKAKLAETIASQFATNYLVWKDKNGTLGFSNVQYPEKHLASVFQTDGWVKMKRPPVPLETTEVQATVRSKAKMAETMASEFSTSCLVWKDKNGALGFGNVRYPDTTAISHVHVDGTWVALKH